MAYSRSYRSEWQCRDWASLSPPPHHLGKHQTRTRRAGSLCSLKGLGGDQGEARKEPAVGSTQEVARGLL